MPSLTIVKFDYRGTNICIHVYLYTYFHGYIFNTKLYFISYFQDPGQFGILLFDTSWKSYPETCVWGTSSVRGTGMYK